MRRFAVGVLRIFRRAFGGVSGVFCGVLFAAGLCGVLWWAVCGVYLAGVRAFLRRFVCGVLWRDLWGAFAAGVLRRAFLRFFRVVSFGRLFAAAFFLGGVFLAADFDGGFCGLSGR